MPAMVLRRRGPIPSPPANLDIRLVKTANGLREWTKTSALAFSMHDARAFEYMLTQRGREISQSTTYLGYASGRPVSTSAAFVSDGVMGIFGIGTLRDARGRGYGEAMTWATIREGRSKGCDLIYLEASPMGFPIYYRMGFRRAFDVEEWVVPRDAPDVE